MSIEEVIADVLDKHRQITSSFGSFCLCDAWDHAARSDWPEHVASVIAERLGIQPTDGKVCTYHGQSNRGTGAPLSTFGLLCHNPLDCDRVPLWRVRALEAS